MKNKKMIAAVAGIVAFVLIGVLASRQGAGTDAGADSTKPGTATAAVVTEQTESSAGTESQPGAEPAAEKEEDQSDTGGTTESKKSEEKGADKISEEDTEESIEGTEKNSGSGAVVNDEQGQSSHSISSHNASWKNLENYYDGTSTNPEVSPTPKIADDLSFPYTVPNQDLVVRKIASYDGVFLEDGSDSEVEGIAVIILENTGVQAVQYAEIVLSGTGGQYTFECSDLPAGGVAVVQEKSAALFKESVHWRKCECATSMLDELEMSLDKVKVIENEDGSLLVENISDEDIPCVRVFYKFYDEENDAYVGGITYTVKITDLAVGTQVTVTPSHYAGGFSRIMMVRTYDTAD